VKVGHILHRGHLRDEYLHWNISAIVTPMQPILPLCFSYVTVRANLDVSILVGQEVQILLLCDRHTLRQFASAGAASSPLP